MNKPGHAPIRSALVMAGFLALPSESFAQVKVITSGGFAAALQEILPEFEKATGITVAIGRGPSQGKGPNTIDSQLRRGVPADAVILSREGLDELIASPHEPGRRNRRPACGAVRSPTSEVWSVHRL